MFGRKDRDEYEEYNQRQNAKYDDDYISDTEEYRDECTHSHEQSYEDYDYRQPSEEYREECDHGHEQTYEDFNSEQKPYDEQSELAGHFAKYLESGEYIIWCGKAEKDAKASESGGGFSSGIGAVIILVALLLICVATCISIVLLVMLFVMKCSSVKNREYAITNRRLITLNNGVMSPIPLTAIVDINCFSGPRNIGYVTFRRTDVKVNNNRYYQAKCGIFAIKEPAVVRDILRDAALSSRNYNGSV